MGNVVGAAFVVGTVVYAIVAQASTPELEPARSFIHWQALWGNGTYGVKYTFVLTWTTVLLVPLAPFGLVSSVLGMLVKRQPDPEMPGWPRLEWPRPRQAVRGLLGAVGTALALAFAAACLVDPRIFVPIGFLAKIALILMPIALLMGPMVTFDATMPARVLVGEVEAVDREAGASADQVRHVLLVAGHRFEVPEALWSQLEPGDEIALRSTRMFRRIIELARRDPSTA